MIPATGALLPSLPQCILLQPSQSRTGQDKAIDPTTDVGPSRYCGGKVDGSVAVSSGEDDDASVGAGAGVRRGCTLERKPPLSSTSISI